MSGYRVYLWSGVGLLAELDGLGDDGPVIISSMPAGLRKESVER